MTRLTSTRFGLAGLALIVAACSSDSNGNNDGTGGAGGDGTGGTAGASGAGGSGGSSGHGGAGGSTGGSGGLSHGGGGSGGVAQGGGGSGGVAQGGGGSGGQGHGGGGAGGTGGIGGAGGSGGQPVVVTDPCNRVTWVATGNPTNVPGNGIDGQLGTRWTTGTDANGDESYSVKFPKLVTISGVTLNVTGNANDFPVSYTVDYSTNGTDFSPILAEDGGPLSGSGAVITEINFPQPTTLMAVRVNQTGVSTFWWSIREFTVNDCAEYSPDAGAPDAGGLDSGTSDAAAPDASTGDASIPDASLDAGDAG